MSSRYVDEPSQPEDKRGWRERTNEHIKGQYDALKMAKEIHDMNIEREKTILNNPNSGIDKRVRDKTLIAPPGVELTLASLNMTNAEVEAENNKRIADYFANTNVNKNRSNRRVL